MKEPLLRPPTDDDIAALVAIEHAAGIEQGLEPTSGPEEIAERWASPVFDREVQERVAVVDGHVVGSASMWREGPQVHAGGYVLEAFRGRGIGTRLLDWVTVDGPRLPGVEELHAWAPGGVAGAIALVEGRPGAEHIRTFVRMMNRAPHRTLEPVWPDGITLGRFEGKALVDAFVEAHDNSFIDHWNFVPADPEEIADEVQRETVDPALWFIAVEGESIAGFNICYLKRGESVARGWVGPIGTTRGYRARGVARALLRHGLRELAARGATEVLLGVDQENPNGALGLYERNGFVRHSEGRVYRLPV